MTGWEEYGFYLSSRLWICHVYIIHIYKFGWTESSQAFFVEIFSNSTPNEISVPCPKTVSYDNYKLAKF